MSEEEQQRNNETKDDEEMRKLLRPSPNEDTIISLLKQHYCADNETIQFLQKLDSYDDYNCLVSLNNEKYLCKVYNGVASQSFQKGQNKHSSIVLYNALFDHLSKTNNHINASYAIPTKKTPSNYYCTLLSNVESTSYSPQELIVQLLHWVDGEPMSSCKSLTKNDFIDAGMYIGKLSIELDKFVSTQDISFINHWKHYFQAWDIKHTMNVRKFIKYINTKERQQLVIEAIDEFEDTIIKSGACDKFRYSLCHGDFNDANIIMKDGKVSGVIDFGDCCYSWRVADIAIAMAYSLLTSYSTSTNRSLSASANFLRGFQSVNPLTSIEVQYLRILIQSRLAQSVTYGAYAYSQNPDPYLLLHSKPAWNALEMLSNGGKEQKERIDKFYVTAGNTQDVSDIDFLDSDVIG